MRVLVCIKRVPATGGQIVLTPDEQAIDTRHLPFVISPHEECAVEEAVRLVEAAGGESVALTLGPAEAETQLREAMAIGIDRGILLQTEGEEWDGQATARAIAAAARADEAEAGAPFDLILLGTESADASGYQVGLRVAAALGRPCAVGIKGVAMAGAGGAAGGPGGTVRAEQEVAGGARDVYELPLPAVLTVKEGLNRPRYPSVPGKLRAKKKPVAVGAPEGAPSEGPDAAPARLERVRLVVPEGRAKQAEVLGNGAAAAPAVVELLQTLGVV